MMTTEIKGLILAITLCIGIPCLLAATVIAILAHIDSARNEHD